MRKVEMLIVFLNNSNVVQKVKDVSHNLVKHVVEKHVVTKVKNVFKTNV